MSLSETARIVAIRRATTSDARALERLVAALADELGAAAAKRSSPADFVAAMSASPPHFYALLAERAGEAIGMCIWFPWFSTWRGAAGVYVQDLYVVSTMRGRGVARRLLAAAAEGLRPPKATFLRLSVDAANVAGLGFYGALGFTHVERAQALVLSGTPFRQLLDESGTTSNVTEP